MVIYRRFIDYLLMKRLFLQDGDLNERNDLFKNGTKGIR